MKLFLVHCGYYDPSLCDGAFESHINVFVAAKTFEDAKIKAKQHEMFHNLKMHVDGLQEVTAVDGFKIFLQETAQLEGKSIITTNRHRDLAPKKPV